MSMTTPSGTRLSATKRAELRGKISMMPGLNRFLRVIPGGLLRVDKTKAEALGRLHWSVCAYHL
jgi:environmental stress-induced protein Ves